jgi:hypothetical protein
VAAKALPRLSAPSRLRTAASSEAVKFSNVLRSTAWTDTGTASLDPKRPTPSRSAESASLTPNAAALSRNTVNQPRDKERSKDEERHKALPDVSRVPWLHRWSQSHSSREGDRLEQLEAEPDADRHTARLGVPRVGAPAEFADSTTHPFGCDHDQGVVRRSLADDLT